MLAFLVVMAAANVLVTAGARLPLSEQKGSHPTISGRLGPRWERIIATAVETPIPQDWTAFSRQMQHQRTGGPGYLLGERRQGGWWYYYFVCMAVKMPLGLWFLAACRLVMGRGRTSTSGDRLALTLIVGTLVIVSLGSSRNYGYRYVLFLAPAALVWLSALAGWGRRGGLVALLGLAGQAAAVASIHPHELSYFNVVVGGPEGGKFVLADSNLDWGQGARSLTRVQKLRPELRDLTLFYFGDTDPSYYGVVGDRFLVDAHEPRRPLPRSLGAVSTRYIAVSRSLEHGPWGPEGYFDALRTLQPVAWTDDHTIAIYRTSDLSSTAP